MILLTQILYYSFLFLIFPFFAYLDIKPCWCSWLLSLWIIFCPSIKLLISTFFGLVFMLSIFLLISSFVLFILLLSWFFNLEALNFLLPIFNFLNLLNQFWISYFFQSLLITTEFSFYYSNYLERGFFPLIFIDFLSNFHWILK